MIFVYKFMILNEKSIINELDKLIIINIWVKLINYSKMN